MMKNAFLLGALAAMLFGCGAAPEETGSVENELRGPICAVACIAPPDGCEYVGGQAIGTHCSCGHIVCKKGPAECPIIDCAAPPAGCHYEGMVTSPCDQQTCGKLVCDSTNR